MLHDPERITYFAQTDARNRRVPFGIKAKDRAKHVYVIGKTGMGKSTLLENMAVQDIQNGEGVTFIDPHGSTAEKLLEYVPEERTGDVLYFAPFDLQYPISFNVIEDVEPDQRFLVVNGLMSTFEKIWADTWSARMAYILQNTIMALLEYPGATLLGINRMYTDKEYRKRVVEHVTDPSTKAFWVDEYAKYTDRYTQEATPAIQNKIGQFAANPLIRNIIGQPTSAFNIRELIDRGKIIIVNLSKGRVGEGNANLLGSMFITKLYLSAMSRADAPPSTMAKLPDHHLYVDEFQNFANRSFSDILSEARKYKLALTIAHQYIEQMEEEVRAAVFGNVGTMITFRVGAYDAEVLEKEFAPAFRAEDLVNLGFAQIYLKLMIDGVSSQPFSATTLPPIEEPEISFRDRVIAQSRRRFARPRAEVENEIHEWHRPIDTSTPPGERLRQRKGEGQARQTRRQPEAARTEEGVSDEASTQATHAASSAIKEKHDTDQAAEAQSPEQGECERSSARRNRPRSRSHQREDTPERNEHTRESLRAALAQFVEIKRDTKHSEEGVVDAVTEKREASPHALRQETGAGERARADKQQRREEKRESGQIASSPKQAARQDKGMTSGDSSELRSLLASYAAKGTAQTKEVSGRDAPESQKERQAHRTIDDDSANIVAPESRVQERAPDEGHGSRREVPENELRKLLEVYER